MANQQTPVIEQSIWQALTEKEKQVLALAAQGITRDQIAKEVGLAKSTIDKMLSNEEGPRSIYQKIGVTSFPQAVNWYHTYVPVSSPMPPIPPQLPLPPPELSTQLLTARYVPLLYTALFFAYLLFMFLPLWLAHSQDSRWNDWAGIYFLSPLLAGLYGLTRCYQLHRQADHRRLWALGILFAAFVLAASNQAVWMAYSLALDESYPSIIDCSNVAAYLLFLVGVLRLTHAYPHAKAAGQVTAGVLALLLFGCVFALLLVVSYGQFNEDSNPVKFALNLYYPTISGVSMAFFAELFYRALYTNLSQTTQCAMRYLFLGAVVWFITDTGFSVISALSEQYWLAYHNGSWIDFGFSVAFWLGGLGLLQLTEEQQAVVAQQAG